ncbi:MAG TPA: glycosyltransferase family 2 protein [Candidatus Saccharimonadia bacterium]|nr:glycosyltransferase family 2 protein [Candidatus Saccharimonadia bacterium]
MNVLRNYIRRHPVKSQRALEILPGFTSWSLILFPVWGSFLIPQVVAYYIIFFDVYWLYRSLSMAVLSTISYFKLQAAKRYDWMGDLKNFPDWEKVNHVVIIPTYKEPITTLERTLDSLTRQTFPIKRISVMVSFEVREGAAATEKAKLLTEKYGPIFRNFWTTMHPDIAGEVKGKSSNTSWGAKLAKKRLIDEQGVDINYTTISSEDADAIFHEQYFSALAFKFLDDPKRYNRIWQPPILCYNNIWKVPAPVRVFASIFSVNSMFTLMREDRLINFSTYSISLKLIDQIGYWDTDVIPEDYRLFFKTYFALKGDLEVKPIFLPVNVDAAEAVGFWPTMLNQYEQTKRWAWGVSDDAYILKQWIVAEDVPFWDKTIRVLKTVEDHFLWPVNWFAITIGALFPPLLNQSFNRSIIGKTLPQVSSAILTLSLVSLFAVFVIDARARPPRPHSDNILKKLMQPVEFILMPVIGFFFAALPGLDSHTRLMLGKYIEYRVTEKV